MSFVFKLNKVQITNYFVINTQVMLYYFAGDYIL